MARQPKFHGGNLVPLGHELGPCRATNSGAGSGFRLEMIELNRAVDLRPVSRTSDQPNPQTSCEHKLCTIGTTQHWEGIYSILEGEGDWYIYSNYLYEWY